MYLVCRLLLEKKTMSTVAWALEALQSSGTDVRLTSSSTAPTTCLIASIRRACRRSFSRFLWSVISCATLSLHDALPIFAVASATTQITGASVSGAMVHMRRGGVDMKMSGVMIVGGLLGSFVGAAMFRALQSSGQIDVVIGLLYVLILGAIGFLMFKDSLTALGYIGPKEAAQRAPRHNRWVASLPLRWRFYSSGLYLSPVAPLALGFLAGVLTVFLC